MFKNYLLLAFRSVLRNRTVSFINIFGLAVSMSVCLLLILIVADQYSYDNFHSKKDNVYRVITDRTQLKEYVWSTATSPFPMASYLEAHPGIENITVIERHFDGLAEWNNQAIPFHGYYTDNDFLEIFDFPLAEGNPSQALTLPNSIVITEKLADKLFGEASPLNEVIEVEDVGEFIVTGVFEKFPGKTHFDFEALASVHFITQQQPADSLDRAARRDDWQNIYDSYVYFSLAEDQEPSSLFPMLEDASTTYYDKESDFTYDFKVQALTGITPGPLLSNTTGFGLPNFMIYIMLGIALVILLSACFNYANLTTARAINRSREIGVRKVVGAGQFQIFLQIIIEAVVIAVIAFIFADLSVQFLLDWLNEFLLTMGAPIGFDQTRFLYGWFLLFVVLAGVLAGLFPAIFFSRTNPVQALKRTLRLDMFGRKLGIKKLDIRKVLVVIQFAFTIFFVITIITIYQQTKFVLNKDHGFRTENLINIRLQGMDFEDFDAMASTMSSLQGIAAVTHLPALGTNNTMNTFPEGEEEPLTMSYFGVDEGYIPVMGLELLAGRNFPEEMPEDERYIIINEEAVQRIGWETPYDAIGQLIRTEDTELEILGVVKDFHYERLDEQIGPMALRYKPQWANHAVVQVSGNNPAGTIKAIESSWKEQSIRPFEYSWFKEDMRISYGHFEALLMILGYVTIISVSIACLGLLGMVIYHIQNKTKELGIRKTLGANAGSLLVTLGKGFFLLILIAYLIAGPLAYFVNMAWLETNAYRIDFGLPTVLLGLIVVLGIVAATIGAQLYKAMHINPVDSLRSE